MLIFHSSFIAPNPTQRKESKMQKDIPSKEELDRILKKHLLQEEKRVIQVKRNPYSITRIIMVSVIAGLCFLVPVIAYVLLVN